MNLNLEYFYDKSEIHRFPHQETLEDKHKYYEEQVKQLFECKDTMKQRTIKIFIHLNKFIYF